MHFFKDVSYSCCRVSYWLSSLFVYRILGFARGFGYRTKEGNSKRSCFGRYTRTVNRGFGFSERFSTRNSNRFGGKYSITAPADGILVFSFVGMEKQEIPVKGRNNILVTMRSSSVALSDVVVIGYGKQSKAALTSAITKVDSKDMAISPTGNPMSMLQGKVPGMEIRVNSGQPGADPQL